LKLLKNIESGKVFLKDIKTDWKCRNCGYIHSAESSPKLCPACIHPQAFFELQCENY
jgi:rubrerythrin